MKQTKDIVVRKNKSKKFEKFEKKPLTKRAGSGNLCKSPGKSGKPLRELRMRAEKDSKKSKKVLDKAKLMW